MCSESGATGSCSRCRARASNKAARSVRSRIPWTSIYTFGGESCAATHPIALVYDVNRAVMSAFGDLNFVTCAVAALAYGPRCVSVCPRWAYVM